MTILYCVSVIVSVSGNLLICLKHQLSVLCLYVPNHTRTVTLNGISMLTQRINVRWEFGHLG